MAQPSTKKSGQEQVDETYWADLLRPIFNGKKVIVTGDPLAGLLPTARLVRELGSEDPFMLATHGVGAGELPGPQDGKWLALNPAPTENFVEAIHAGLGLLKHLPDNAVAALDQYDPDHTAIVLSTFLHDFPEVAGRKVFSYRKTEWLALEDKTKVDALWDEADVAHELMEIVSPEADALLAAGKRLDRGDGTVWSGDSRDGSRGGAETIRWVRTSDDVDEAADYFKKHCDRVRVMPFLEGIPCSIHGIVFPDYIAALRPVEMVTLRESKSGRLFYAGTASYWDPAPADREYMRDIAKRVGNVLRKKVNYLGIFTIDGVMSKNGFRPTELNPRSGAGIRSLVSGLPHLPFQLVADALSGGLPLDFKPEALESHVVRSADAHRGGGTERSLFTKISEQIDSKPVTIQSDDWQWATEHQAINGIVSVGPNAFGSLVRLGLDATTTPKGFSVAPLACSFWRFVDRELATGVGPLEPAKSMR